MDTDLNVAIAPKDSTYQVRINSEIKRAVEGLPFIVTKNSREALKEQAIAILMLDLKRAEERADAEGWIDADDLERELGVLDEKENLAKKFNLLGCFDCNSAVFTYSKIV